MADISIWQDEKARQDFVARSRQRFEDIREGLRDREDAVIVAIEPESGDYFVGQTLGQANDAAFGCFPDQWVYFARVDNPEAAIPLPTW